MILNGKRIFLSICAALALLALPSCMQLDYNSLISELEASAAERSAPEPAPPPEPRETLRIAVATSPGDLEDGFNREVAAGAQCFVDAYEQPGLSAVPERSEAGAVRAVTAVAGNYDVIVAVGQPFAELAAVARANPERFFILVDALPQGAGSAPENLCALLFQEQENGFYAGVAAALETQTGKVAFAGGVPTDNAFRRQTGFEAGVSYANNRLGTLVEVVNLADYAGGLGSASIGGNYAGADTPAQGRKAANALLAVGCDILYVDEGGFRTGVFEAVRENETARVIVGSEADAGEGRDIVLLSVRSDVAAAVERALLTVREGRFHGGIFPQGAETGVTGCDTTQSQLLEVTIAELAALEELVRLGVIVPPDGFSGTMPEDFPGLWF